MQNNKIKHTSAIHHPLHPPSCKHAHTRGTAADFSSKLFKRFICFIKRFTHITFCCSKQLNRTLLLSSLMRPLLAVCQRCQYATFRQFWRVILLCKPRVELSNIVSDIVHHCFDVIFYERYVGPCVRPPCQPTLSVTKMSTDNVDQQWQALWCSPLTCFVNVNQCLLDLWNRCWGVLPQRSAKFRHKLNILCLRASQTAQSSQNLRCFSCKMFLCALWRDQASKTINVISGNAFVKSIFIPQTSCCKIIERMMFFVATQGLVLVCIYVSPGVAV